MKKSRIASEAKRFTDIPNVGPRVARNFELIGLKDPSQLKGGDAHKLYLAIGKKKGKREDPCLLDVLLAVTDFMNGGNPKPWWFYTKKRKETYPNI